MADTTRARKTKEAKLTAEYLRSVMDYDPETGEFWWKPTRAGCITSEGRVQIALQGKIYRAHRLAWLWMTGEWPPDPVDHWNMDATDNRWVNLRLATNTENKRNVGSQPRRSPLYDGQPPLKGVSPFKGGKWQSFIKVNGQSIYLGLYDTQEEAYAAYCEASAKYHGEFGRT